MSAGISILKDLVSSGSGGSSTGAHPKGVLSEDGGEAMIRQAELAALYQFWVDKKSSLGKIPCRADFSPLELTRLLPHIALVDVDHASGTPEFTFRLCGTQIAEDSGVDLTGKTWSHFPNSEQVIKRAIKLTENLQPYYATNIQAKWAPKNFHHYSVLALPLSKDGEQVDMILYGVMFHPYTS
ncbi:PAS domain-containing protein [Kordiimonas lacus]|uniref:PAS domain-containing protein n=1 Tax=Kordiimonas lacus TaxID=637679 RepID=A0A1G7AYS4_9PROT|nr:PAS domain-containing protein [Kordiimonas lacus]SDE19737.1 PAS domain-containing protein [Kordiimonas lacus]